MYGEYGGAYSSFAGYRGSGYAPRTSVGAVDPIAADFTTQVTVCGGNRVAASFIDDPGSFTAWEVSLDGEVWGEIVDWPFDGLNTVYLRGIEPALSTVVTAGVNGALC